MKYIVINTMRPGPAVGVFSSEERAIECQNKEREWIYNVAVNLGERNIREQMDAIKIKVRGKK